jgi:glyceraldehyde 3-phosphate dehydrogenase
MINQSKWFYLKSTDKNVSDIINLHQYAGEFVGKHIRFDSVEIARAIWELDLPPKLDIGKLTYEYLLDDEISRCKTFCFRQIKNAKSSEEIQPKDVVLYGLVESVVC